jgi:hypothetical protein
MVKITNYKRKTVIRLFMSHQICSLSDAIGTYLRKTMRIEDSKWYMGTLSNYSTDRGHNQDTVGIILKRVMGKSPYPRLSGYLILDSKGNTNEITYLTEQESLVFDFSAQRLTITAHPFQLTRTQPELPQAITKQDWYTPHPFNISLRGDYSQHLELMRSAHEEFALHQTAELWIPELFLKEGE